MAYNFTKEEKLKSRKAIEMLFSDGKSFSQYPIRIVYRINNSDENRIAFSVAKKKFKKAVDRNLLKRRMREAYRLNKNIIENQPKKVDMIFIYLSHEQKNYQTIDSSVKSIFKKLDDSLNSF